MAKRYLWVIPKEDKPITSFKSATGWISPSHFLGLVRHQGRVIEHGKKRYMTEKEQRSMMSEKTMRELKLKFKRRTPINIPFVDIQKGKVIEHEGRHRAYAAKEIGIKRIPVRFYLR